MSTLDHMLEPEAQVVRRVEVITGTGRRRRFAGDDKARIIEETLAPGAVVSEIARRHGLTPQQLFGWRRQARQSASSDIDKKAGPVFVPAVVNAPVPAPRSRIRGTKQAFEPWLRGKLELISQKTKLAEAIRYALSRWQGLTRFIEDGRIDIDSNVVERSIRPIALNRKNALFAGSDDGGEHWAVIASLTETCKLNAVDPQHYLTDVITKIVDGHPNSQIDHLLRWAYPEPRRPATWPENTAYAGPADSASAPAAKAQPASDAMQRERNVQPNCDMMRPHGIWLPRAGSPASTSHLTIEPCHGADKARVRDTRHGADWTERYPQISGAARKLKVHCEDTVKSKEGKPLTVCCAASTGRSKVTISTLRASCRISLTDATLAQPSAKALDSDP